MKRRKNQKWGIRQSERRDTQTRGRRRLLLESLEQRTLLTAAPIAQNDGYSVFEDTVLDIAAAGVLANDTDADGDALSAVLQSGPSHGSLVLRSDGSFTYTPDAAFVGSDAFSYLASDGELESAIATVSISVAEHVPALRTGVATDVGSQEWTTVTLDHTYQNMVVVLSPSYGVGGVPLIARMRNASGNSFQLQVQRADNSALPVTGATVHYTVVEEGIYSQAEHGVKLEAVRFDSTRTDSDASWVGQRVYYQNSYVSPVVVGQVMTANDARASVFWARGSRADYAPSSSYLYVGKHVAEDSVATRAAETIGYIVVESGAGTLDGVDFVAGVGGATVAGPDNGPPATYAINGPADATVAVVSSAGMRGLDGGWAVLAGPGAVTSTSLRLFAEEDKWKDSERRHAAERVSYLVFADSARPQITTVPVTDATEDSSYSYDVDATSPDSLPLTYHLDVVPSGMNINQSTGLIQWTPDNDDVGANSVVVRVQDTQAGTATRELHG